MLRPPYVAVAAGRGSPVGAPFAPQFSEVARTSPGARDELGAAPLVTVKTEAGVGPPRPEGEGAEGGSVFGGLVSYFSSQHEDDMDA